MVTFEMVSTALNEHWASGKIWAIVPAIVAIILALSTKQVYISLFAGICAGAMFLSDGNPINALVEIFYVMSDSMGGSNGSILIFILMLSILVVLISKAGGSRAFGNWASKTIKSRTGAIGFTTVFGISMFMDDYFNRLAVGSVMRPVTDRFRISRAKLAYLIGSLSVSVCILVPISSWASAVTSSIAEGLENAGSALKATDIYMQTILCNFYPILTLLFILVTAALGMEMFSMRHAETNCLLTGDLFAGVPLQHGEEDECVASDKGTILDLLLPIIVLIAASIFTIYYTNNHEIVINGKTIVELKESATELSLAVGATVAVIFALPWYLIRRIMSFKDFTDSFTDAFKSMADVFMILVLAWTLSGICKALNVGEFVGEFAHSIGGAIVILPAVMFLVAMFISFATGTSWGTFGIVVPIVVPMFDAGSTLQILGIAAVLSGAVFGDQVSPISDATILSAKTAKCDHIDYVTKQLPLALVVAGSTFLGFVVAGVVGANWVGLLVSLAVMFIFIAVMYIYQKKHDMLLPKYQHNQE